MNPYTNQPNEQFNKYFDEVKRLMIARNLPIGGLSVDFFHHHFASNTPPNDVVNLILQSQEGQHKVTQNERNNKYAIVAISVVLPLLAIATFLNIYKSQNTSANVAVEPQPINRGLLLADYSIIPTTDANGNKASELLMTFENKTSKPVSIIRAKIITDSEVIERQIVWTSEDHGAPLSPNQTYKEIPGEGYFLPAGIPTPIVKVESYE